MGFIVDKALKLMENRFYLICHLHFLNALEKKQLSRSDKKMLKTKTEQLQVPKIYFIIIYKIEHFSKEFFIISSHFPIMFIAIF